MEVQQVLRMNGGLGENSYANNSLVQRKVIFMTIPIIEESMTELYNSVLPDSTISIADLGCSTGPNTLHFATELVAIVNKLCCKAGRNLPEFHIQLNDLPGNDFNSIFQSLLPRFQEKLSQDVGSRLRPCFLTAVPGSFYGRLFPEKSLHFVHSSYSLMWLSQVPRGAEMNKDNIYLASTSPKCVIKAYYEQFRKDFATFIQCRSQEVIAGGKMVLTILGRKSEDASSKDGCYIWELMAMALKEMVSEGLIEEEKLHSFNIPQYTPSPAEVKLEVEQEGSFVINRLEASKLKWADCGNSVATEDDGYNVAKCMRSVAEPLLVEHFGAFSIDDLFDKYRAILSKYMAQEECNFVNVTVSMTKIQ